MLWVIFWSNKCWCCWLPNSFCGIKGLSFCIKHVFIAIVLFFDDGMWLKMSCGFFIEFSDRFVKNRLSYIIFHTRSLLLYRQHTNSLRLSSALRTGKMMFRFVQNFIWSNAKFRISIDSRFSAFLEVAEFALWSQIWIVLIKWIYTL